MNYLNRVHFLCILIIFLLIGTISYAIVLNAFFVSDDFFFIGRLLDGQWFGSWGEAHGGFFRPLFVLSCWLDMKFWGTRPFGFHLTNILLHAITSFSVYVLAKTLISDLELSSKTKLSMSLAAGLIFLVHPSHTEAVSFVSGRQNLLATLFWSLSLLQYLSYKQTARNWHLGLSLFTFSLALLTKESAICLPLALLIVEIISPPGASIKIDFRQTLKRITPFFLLASIFIFVRAFFIGHFVGGYGAAHLNFSPSWIRDRLIQFTLRALLPPLPLQLSHTITYPLKSPVFLLFGAICLAIISAILIYRRKAYDASFRRKQNIFLLLLSLLYICCLLPVINLRLGLYNTQGEGWIYMASIFSSISIAYVFAILIRNVKLWNLLTVCLLLFYTAGLYRSNLNWKEAGHLSQNILNDLASSSEHNNVVLLNVPDNLRGAYVYRNGLSEALKYFQHRRRFDRVHAIAFHSLQSATEKIEVVNDSGTLTIRLDHENSEFERIDPECIEVVDVSRSAIRLRPGDCFVDADLFFFSEGRVDRIPR